MKIFSLANIITLLNLFFGCLTVLLLVENNLDIQYVFILTFICLILDFFDGLIARYFNMQSDIGIQLDSLADMISFGLVPGIIIYNLFKSRKNALLLKGHLTLQFSCTVYFRLFKGVGYTLPHFVF